ncbi:haloacid dehalogenase type II [Vibrio astriarenae]|nr:haloacid dehalogenase type II [Vibrio sp. C7]
MSGQTVLFDINETVLDLSVLKPKFQQYMGSDDYMATWFAMLLHSSTVCLVTETKSDFKSLGVASLRCCAERLGKTLTDNDYLDILRTFAELPAHEDIKPALSRLRASGLKVVALSNSSSELLTSQLTHAGLLAYFDQVISTQQANTFKPSREAYHFALQKLNINANTARLVATHDWDTHGALSAGLKAAYIDRLNSPYNPHYLKPDIIATDMGP